MYKVGLLIGKKNSSGFPGKNIMKINGLPSCEYGFIAAKECKLDDIYVSTDSEEIAEIGSKYKATWIKRPAELATPDALTEDALIHAYKEICTIKTPDIVVLLFANNPAISIKLIKHGISVLSEDKSYDSAFSVCKYNMFSPTRARRIEDNEIKPFVDLSVFGEISSIRSSQGDVFFCDLSVQVIRGEVFTRMHEGMQPFQWMGKKSYPLLNDYGFDIDEPWQKAAIELWLRNNWEKQS